MWINCGYSDTPQGLKLLAYHGPNIKVSIGLEPTWTKGQNRAPRADKTDIEALIDTGAQECCIDSALAKEIGLPEINKRKVGGVGLLLVDVYHCQVHIPMLKYT